MIHQMQKIDIVPMDQIASMGYLAIGGVMKKQIFFWFC